MNVPGKMILDGISMNPGKMIYLAGPLFSEAERNFLEAVAARLALLLEIDVVADIFVPHRDAGELGDSLLSTRPAIFQGDIEALGAAKIVVAWLDGSDVDSGTATEIGYAYALNTPVVGLVTDFRIPIAETFTTGPDWKINNMIWGMCDSGKTLCTTVDDAARMVQKLIGVNKLVYDIHTGVVKRKG